MKMNSRTVVSLILKLVVIVSAVVGTILCVYAGRNSFMGGMNVFMYFTIQSNIALAVISLVGAIWMLSGKRTNHVLQVINLVGAVAITLTGMVFCFVLAPTMWSVAWSIQNVLTHVVVPVVAVVDFFVTAGSYSYKLWEAVWVLVPPILYAIYAGIGYVQRWEFGPGVYYPYFFLNWGSPAGAFGFTNQLPFMGCAWWILALLVFLLLVGAFYLKLVGWIYKKRK